ncbi:hypothetical protein XU05_000947 [Salmonella enterica subsp. enterica]|nr:hypothetical protein [Salmonella enterica subsp. enterica]
MSIHNFPEVYHGEGIIISLFSGAARRVTGKGHNTTSGSNSSWLSRYILCYRAAARRMVSVRSYSTFFRIFAKKRENYI